MKNSLTKLALAVVCLHSSINYETPPDGEYLEDSDLYSDVAEGFSSGWNWRSNSASAIEVITVNGQRVFVSEAGGGGGGAGGGGAADESTEREAYEDQMQRRSDERSQKKCQAHAEANFKKCEAYPKQTYYETLENECKYLGNVQVGADGVFVNGSVSVNEYSMCKDLAEARRDSLLNDCSVNRANHLLRCLN